MPHNLTVPSSTVALKNACLLHRSDFNPIMTFLRIIESLVVPGWSSSRRLAKSLNEIRATDDSNYPLLCDKRQALATAVPEFVVLFRVNIRVPMLAAQDFTGVAETF